MALALPSIYAELHENSLRGVDAAKLSRETGNLLRRPGLAPLCKPFEEPARSCRLVVAPVRLLPALQTRVLACRDSARACLRSVSVEDVYYTPLHQWHVTLFHTGRNGDARPLSDDGLAREARLVQSLVESTPSFTLRVERLLLTDTGVFLILYSGHETPFAFRAAMRERHADAPAKQAVILHSSLFRLMAVPTADELQALRAVCEAASSELRGCEVPFTSLWYVLETALPVEGEVFEWPLAQA